MTINSTSGVIDASDLYRHFYNRKPIKKQQQNVRWSHSRIWTDVVSVTTSTVMAIRHICMYCLDATMIEYLVYMHVCACVCSISLLWLDSFYIQSHQKANSSLAMQMYTICVLCCAYTCVCVCMHVSMVIRAYMCCVCMCM